MNFEHDNNCLNGTYLLGHIIASYDKLVEVFGYETSNGDEYNVQAEWSLKFEDGTVASIYDWMESESYNGVGDGIPKEKVTRWHIGGLSDIAVEHVQNAIANVSV